MMSCRLCSSKKIKERKVRNNLVVIRCHYCGVEFLKEFPGKAVLEKFYKTQEYYRFWGKLNWRNIKQVEQVKKATAERVLDLIEQYGKKGKILDVGCATGTLLMVAKMRGWEIYGVEVSGDFARITRERLGDNVYQGMFEEAPFKAGSFDMVLFYDSLEHMTNPQKIVAKVFKILKPGGCLVVFTPNRESLSARIMGRNWTHYKTEHLFYFSPKSLKEFLNKEGFETVAQGGASKALNITYINSQFQTFPTPVLTPLFKLIVRYLPAPLVLKPFYLSTGEMFLVARKKRRKHN